MNTTEEANERIKEHFAVIESEQVRIDHFDLYPEMAQEATNHALITIRREKKFIRDNFNFISTHVARTKMTELKAIEEELNSRLK